MAGPEMDVTVGEVAAICDFSNELQNRSSADFLTNNCGKCILCGTIDDDDARNAVRHLACPAHQKRAQQYRACTRTLLSYERTPTSCVSPREVVLTYLGNRLAQATIIRGLPQYHSTAVRYLLGRASTPDLLRSFQDVTGTEASPTRGVCAVCFERPSCMMFKDCRHVCVCMMCAARLRVSTEDEDAMCPMCRKRSDVLAVFIS